MQKVNGLKMHLISSNIYMAFTIYGRFSLITHSFYIVHAIKKTFNREFEAGSWKIV